jgi:hypothetical protein
MIIGTVRPEEARVFDSHNGYHSFHDEDSQEPYGSLEVFWNDGTEGNDNCANQQRGGQHDYRDSQGAGWYWWACFPGCLPDGDASGPFANSRQALEDADEWNPEFDDIFER